MVKLKKELNRLKELPFLVRIVYGTILIIGVLVMVILKVTFISCYFSIKKLEAFSTRYLKPIFNSLNEFIYKNACDVFDCEKEVSGSSSTNESIEQTLPIFLRLKKVFIRISTFLFGSNKTLKISLAKKRLFRSSKIAKSESKGWFNLYIIKFHTLFRLLEY